jgi:hypothetical protein
MRTTKRQRAELQAMLERARRNEASAPRKHHLVPGSYLKRWAENGRICVTEIDAGTSYETSPTKAARVTDFYRLEAEGLDPQKLPPLLFETALSEVESWGSHVVEALITQPSSLEPDLMAKFAWFLGFQLTRGAAQRAEMRIITNEFFKIQYGDLTDEGIRRELIRRGAEPTPKLIRESRRLLDEVRDGSLFVAPQDAALTGHAGEAAMAVGEHFLYRAWIVCRTPKVMLTCDEPVVTVGGPGSPRGERAGVATAGVILFPLSSENVLVMMRDDLALAHGIDAHRSGGILADELNAVEAIDVCREIVMNAHRWVFDRPGRDLASHFHIPPAPAAAAVEEVGPAGDGDSEGVLMRTFRQSRWTNHEGPAPWPVSRWWQP